MLTRIRHIKGYRRQLSDGSVKFYRYHRITGKRIYGEPGTPEFAQSYAEASVSNTSENHNSISSLIARYKRSRKFSKLANRTRSDYDKQFKIIVEKWGNVPVKAFEDRRIRDDLIAWRDELASRSERQADYALAVFRILLKFGVDIGRLKENHASGIENLYSSDRSELIWLSADIDRFLKVARIELQAAMIFALHSGQRQADILTMTWTAYDGKGLLIKQRKTGRRVYVPCTSGLKRTLDNLPRRSITILTNSRGRPWTSDGFRTSWHKNAKKAGIEELTFHDLRGTAVTMLSEAGCTAQEVATITGHSLKQVESILDSYLARTKPMAEAAIIKLENSLATKVTYELTYAPFVPNSLTDFEWKN